jgi:hypothetical protein
VRFDQDVVAKEPGRVVIFAGVGDALREKTLEEYQKNLKAMVEKAEANHTSNLSLPCRFPIRERINYINNIWTGKQLCSGKEHHGTGF